MLRQNRVLQSVTALALVAALAGCGGVAREKAAADTPASATAPQALAGVDKTMAAGPDTHVSSTNVIPLPAPTAPTAPAAPSSPSSPAAGGGSQANPGSGTQPATQPTQPSTQPATQPIAAQPEPAQPGTPGPVNPTTPTPTPPPVSGPLSVQTIERGAYSGVTSRSAVLITDSATWETQWQRTAGTRVPTPAAPPVDFNSSSVVAVYMGQQRSGGYSVEVTGAELTNGTLKVTVRQTSPGPGSMVTMALTQPYHLVRIPKVPAGTKLEVNWQ